MKSLVPLLYFFKKQIRFSLHSQKKNKKKHEDKTMPEPETDNNKLQITYFRTFKEHDLDVLLIENMRYYLVS